MPPDLLNNFIAAQPPDLGEIQEIADDNTDNREFYSSLSIAYLTSALKSADRDSVRRLNARRAQAVLKQKTSVSVVYKEQAGRLYSYEYGKKYPLLQMFLDDQRNMTAEQIAIINEDADGWVASIRTGMENIDEAEKPQLEEMISIAENARNKGLNNLYWAYILFRYLCSEGHLTLLRVKMSDGNTSQQIARSIQRYSTLCSVLDPSAYFTQQYIEAMQVQQFTALLPSHVDHERNMNELQAFLEEFTKEFTKKYINSPDPAMMKRAQEVDEALTKNLFKEYLEVLSSVALVGSQAWYSVAVRFKKASVARFGKHASGLAEMMLSGMTAFAIFELCTGMVEWKDLNLAEKGEFIVGCFAIVATFIRKGTEARLAYESTSAVLEIFRV